MTGNADVSYELNELNINIFLSNSKSKPDENQMLFPILLL